MYFGGKITEILVIIIITKSFPDSNEIFRDIIDIEIHHWNVRLEGRYFVCTRIFCNDEFYDFKLFKIHVKGRGNGVSISKP